MIAGSQGLELTGDGNGASANESIWRISSVSTKNAWSVLGSRRSSCETRRIGIVRSMSRSPKAANVFVHDRVDVRIGMPPVNLQVEFSWDLQSSFPAYFWLRFPRGAGVG